ncbi:unnamed protein product [Moneuplotes crassus]|uniref:Uncharacterized protein n=1 Tax=Euplotes crassus TaxID=5936 RepID=A0AAD2DAR8_EUPCR|nr:unnamed protein product [Moneuplotes crassus]
MHKFKTCVNSFRNKSKNLIPEVTEEELSQEAPRVITPKKVSKFQRSEEKYLKQIPVAYEVDQQILARSEEKRIRLPRQATHTVKNRRILKTYLKSNLRLRTFIPLKSHQITASNVVHNIRDEESYLPQRNDTFHTRESTSSRISGAYICSEHKIRASSNCNNHHKTSCLARSIPRNGHIAHLGHNSRMSLSKPLFYKRNRG